VSGLAVETPDRSHRRPARPERKNVNPYLTQFIVEAHATELTGRARQSRLARDTRASRGPRSVRTATARILVAAAARLDRPRRAAVPCPDTGAGT
jgi:hypothetical protein